MTHCHRKAHAAAVSEATTLGIDSCEEAIIIRIVTETNHTDEDLNELETELSRIVRQNRAVRSNAVFLLSFTHALSELMVSMLLRIQQEIHDVGGRLHLCLSDAQMDMHTSAGLHDFILPTAGGCLPSACALCAKHTTKN